jgi:hypothetical protein
VVWGDVTSIAKYHGAYLRNVDESIQNRNRVDKIIIVDRNCPLISITMSHSDSTRISFPFAWTQYTMVFT